MVEEVSPCLRLFNSKWIVVMSRLWCTPATHLQRCLEAVCSPYSLSKCTLCASLPEGSWENHWQPRAWPSPQWQKPMGTFISWVWQREKDMILRSTRMNRPALDPRRILKARGTLSGSFIRPSAPRGGIAAIDGAPWCEAQILGLSMGLEGTWAVVVVALWVPTSINGSSWFIRPLLLANTGWQSCPFCVLV